MVTRKLPDCVVILGVERLREQTQGDIRWNLSYIDPQGIWCELALPEKELLRLLSVIRQTQREGALPKPPS